MAYEISSPSPLHHRLQLEGRESLTVSGVEDVVRFDESCIVMTTCAGSMVVTGTELHIGKLSLDGTTSRLSCSCWACRCCWAPPPPPFTTCCAPCACAVAVPC